MVLMSFFGTDDLQSIYGFISQVMTDAMNMSGGGGYNDAPTFD